MVKRDRTSTTRGGCDRCAAKWRGRNAHMLAGKHHKDTKHPTWSQTTGGETHRYSKVNDQPALMLNPGAVVPRYERKP
jgi:hypothetical protein